LRKYIPIKEIIAKRPMGAVDVASFDLMLLNEGQKYVRLGSKRR
jgi:hypothetical protein